MESSMPTGAKGDAMVTTFQPQTVIEPFRVKTVEPIRFSTVGQRRAALEAADFNLFRVPADTVIVDLLTDSGTGAMSSEQWAGMMRGDESYAGAKSWYRFQEAVEKITGFKNILPTHQGRASEHILFEVLLSDRKGESKPTKHPAAMDGSEKSDGNDKTEDGITGPKSSFIVPNNAHFDTTRANIEAQGAVAINLLTEEGTDMSVVAPFKGNMSIPKLTELLDGPRGEDVPFVMMTVTCNSNGGQPVSLTNLREVHDLCQRFHKPLFLDACRFAENAWFIKTREEEQKNRSIQSIVRDMFSLADGATISAKKDGIVNIGGLLLLRDPDVFYHCSCKTILTEGFLTYGGLAGRDLEAMAIGLQEAMDEDYLRYRIRSIEYLGEKLVKAGVPIMRPPGGHGIYIDAGELLPHISRTQFPGQALAVALYEVGGVRGCEIGSVMFGVEEDVEQAEGVEGAQLCGEWQPQNNQNAQELVRLAVPRRTYTQSHIDYVAEVVLEVARRGSDLRGYKIVNAPKELRHFSASFKKLA